MRSIHRSESGGYVILGRGKDYPFRRDVERQIDDGMPRSHKENRPSGRTIEGELPHKKTAVWKSRRPGDGTVGSGVEEAGKPFRKRDRKERLSVLREHVQARTP